MFGLKDGRISASEQFVLFHEDFSHKDVNEALVGRKGESLYRLKDMDIPVPGFFVISPAVFKSHLLKSFEGKLAGLIDKLDSPDLYELEKLIMKTDFDKKFEEEIHQAYTRLSGFSKAWVAVRSSVVYPHDPKISFNGLFKTELNVRGFDHVLDGIKQVYVSVFRDRVARYAKNNSVKLSDLQMAIVVQKMVQPEVSGVAYTVDPITNSDDRLSVEAVFGLGDVITDGSITPDQYVLNKKDLTAVEKHISPQEWMRVRRPQEGNSKDIQEFEKVQISKTWSHQQKLEDRNLDIIAKLALIVEEQSKTPQAVEWVWESGGAWILQAKPLLPYVEPQPAVAPIKAPVQEVVEEEKSTNDSLYDFAVGIVKDGKEKDMSLRAKNIAKAVEDHIVEEVKVSKVVATAASKVQGVDEDLDVILETNQIEEIQDKQGIKREEKKINEAAKEIKSLEKLEVKLQRFADRAKQLSDKMQQVEEKKVDGKLAAAGMDSTPDEAKMEFILTGIGASVGQVVGTVKLLGKDQINVTRKHVLVLNKYDSDMEGSVLAAGGVIMDEGGLTSDLAIICREAKIPAVVGTGLATRILKDNDLIKIDGNVGSIYKFVGAPVVTEDKPTPVSTVSAADSKKANKKSANVDLKPQDETPSQPKPKKDLLPAPITATKVFLRPDLTMDIEDQAEALYYADGVSCVDIDKLMLQSKRHPLSHVENKTYKAYAKNIEKYIDLYGEAMEGDEVIATIGSATSGEMRAMTRGTVFENSDLGDMVFGVQRLIANKELTQRQISIVKSVRNVYKSRNVTLAVHSPMSGSMLSEIKKEISAVGLRRGASFNIYAVIDRGSEAVMVEDLLSAQIDGVVFCAKRIAKDMQGIPVTDQKSPYHVDSNSVTKLLEELSMKMKGSKARLFVATDNDESLIKLAVKLGVYGVIVTGEKVYDAKRLVAEEEARMVLSI